MTFTTRSRDSTRTLGPLGLSNSSIGRFLSVETAQADSAIARARFGTQFVAEVREGLRLHQVAKTYLTSAVVRDSMSLWMRHTYDKCNGQ
jgi:hypothetical protein